MAGNVDNLRPPRTKEEARERGRNGGIKSGEARRKKRTMKKAAKMLLDMPVSFENIQEQMRSLGIAEEDLTNQMAILVSMFKEAMSGNVRASEFLRDTIGDDAAGEDRREKLRMDKKRLEMEQRRLDKQLESDGDDNDGMPTIINVRPDRDNQS